MEFTEENSDVFVTVSTKDTLGQIVKAYRLQYRIKNSDSSDIIAVIIELNKKTYPDIRVSFIKPDWKLKLPTNDFLFERNLSKIVFDGMSLAIYDHKEKLKLKVSAISGLRANNPTLKNLIKEKKAKPNIDYTKSDQQGEENLGPIVERNYVLELKRGVPFERTGGGWGIGAWRLKPQNFVVGTLEKMDAFLEKKTGVGIGMRSGFFLHQDNGRDGTAGCIGIQTRADTVRVWEFLKRYERLGYDEIMIQVEYKN